MSRISTDNTADIMKFIPATADAWMIDGLIKHNSYGVEILVFQTPGADFTNTTVLNAGETVQGMPHDTLWYRDNAKGKNLICLATGLDSLVAVRTYPGLVAQIEGAFPWGGAVIDACYGIIVGVSGFKEDEDILFARTILNRVIMLLDRDGEAVLADARTRGEQTGQAGADRFTRIEKPVDRDTPDEFGQVAHEGTGFAGNTTPLVSYGGDADSGWGHY